MSSTRTATRTLRTARAVQLRPVGKPRTQYRTYASGPEASASQGMSPVVGGIVGGSAVLAVAYGYYHFSGAKTAVNTMRQTSDYFKQAKGKLQEKAPEPNEAIDWLRSTAKAYAGFVPGASHYIDTAFNDLDSVRAKHSDKVDAIVREAYEELRDVSKEGDMSLQTAQRVWSILESKMRQIGELAGDAVEDIVNNHPEIKDKVGGNLQQLRQMKDQYGPEVKEQVDKTWEQINGVIQKGFSASTATEIKKIVDEKMQLIRKLGDEAFQKGMEQAKPYLDKSPRVKELVEQNKDALKGGNVGELWSRVRKAVESGNTEDFEKWVGGAADRAKSQGKSMGVDVDKYLQQIPGSGDIMSKVQQLSEIGQKHGKEAQDIFKSTMDEVKQVLQKKTQEAQKVAEKASKEGSS